MCRICELCGFYQGRSQAELGRLNQENVTRANARQIARQLVSLGINLNFAPVVDLARNPDNPIIARLERSYGSDAELVQQHARWTIEEFHRQGLLCAIKHFPGHGSSREDSHLGLPDVTSLWSTEELRPFAELVARGLPDMVMTSHLYNRHWDASRSATLSRKVVTGMLRHTIGFDGVVVSDDLQMGAIAQTVPLQETIKRSP